MLEGAWETTTPPHFENQERYFLRTTVFIPILKKSISYITANAGHFMVFLKKDTTLQQHPWNLYNDSNDILMRPASFLETCDIFLYIQVDEYL